MVLLHVFSQRLILGWLYFVQCSQIWVVAFYQLPQDLMGRSRLFHGSVEKKGAPHVRAMIVEGKVDKNIS